MSTISTHLNWGASYVVDDVYRRFVRPDADERTLVRLGRLSTVLLMAFASVVALWLESAHQAFQILLQIGAGTGLIFLLRWFWWRINAWSEVTGMVVSFLVAIYFAGGITLEPIGLPSIVSWPVPELEAWQQLLFGIVVTTIAWVAVTFMTRPTDGDTLRRFYDAIRPMGPGWRGAGFELDASATSESPAAAFLAWFLACTVVYGVLFGTGYLLYGDVMPAVACLVAALGAGAWLMRTLPRVGIR